jgi:cytosine/adenosine deaminase-related metal-dependent hydrolase
MRTLLGSVPKILYSASVLCPMSGPPLRDGAVLVEDGAIIAVGTVADLHPSADRRHHVDGVLLPGLVDGHTCLEWSDVRPIARPGPFHVWLRAVLGYTAGWDADRWARSARRGVQDALRHGVTTVVDSVIRGPAVPAAGRAGLAGHSLVQVMLVDHAQHDPVLAAVEASLQRNAHGRGIGVAAHSTYTLSTGVLQALGHLAARHGRPFQIRAGESNAEIAALRTGDGPLLDLAADAGLDLEWAEEGLSRTPVAYLDDLGLLGPRTTIAHGVWLDLADARRLAAAGTAVVCCQRANTALQNGDAPLERFAEAGTPLALGTGSAAAVGDADLLADAAAWVDVARRRDLFFWPSSAGPVPLEEAAVRLATVDGARALGLGDVAGVLAPGRRADLLGVAIDTDPDSVYVDLIRRGIGRQVLTVLGGVRRSRRDDPDQPWPVLEEWRDL